jgi:hypothetical protein
MKKVSRKSTGLTGSWVFWVIVMEFSVYGINKRLNLPDDWQMLKTTPEDKENSIVIAKQTEYSQCIVLIFPIDKENLMPIDNPRSIIDDIHNFLENDQGLIEVNSFNKNTPYIYSIVKTKQEPGGMLYFLRLHFIYNDNYYEINGYFTEIGVTGVRDATVYELARRNGRVKKSLEGWFSDPYDNSFDKGILRNLSEDSSFDKAFPFHPLSEARSFIKIIMEEINDPKSISGNN